VVGVPLSVVRKLERFLNVYYRPVGFPVDQMLIFGGFLVEPRSYDRRSKIKKLIIAYSNSHMIKKNNN